MTKLSAEDRHGVEAVVAAAESRTSAELALVIAEASDDYAAFPVLWAAIGALLAGGITSIALPRLGGSTIFALQAILFVGAGLLLYIRPIRLRIAPGAVKRAHAARLARLEFAALVHDRTRHETGILLFLSLAERHVEILADRAIATRIPDSAWQAIIDALVKNIRSGHMVDGLVNAVHGCTAILEQQFPPKSGQSNEIANQVTEI